MGSLEQVPKSPGAWPEHGGDGRPKVQPGALFGLVVFIATAGLVYELSMAAVASYLLGDSVAQFSLVIGVYLSALGLGAYLSRFVVSHLALRFVDVELCAALFGGFSVPALLFAFAYLGAFELVLYVTVGIVGVLVGLELPLLMRALEHRVSFRELIARAFTFDYIGSLLGSLAFTFVLVPRLGLLRSSLSCGLLNAGVALASTWLLLGVSPEDAAALRRARLRAAAVLALLILGLIYHAELLAGAERASLPGRVLYAEQTRYQRIVVSEQHGTLRLFLNGHLQFSSADEYRYHEALVQPALGAARQRRHVLIGGGGDGLAAREVLRWPDVERVTLVDLDPGMTDLARRLPELRRLNHAALDDPRLEIVNQDALTFLRRTRERYDAAILDFPDPSNYSIGKLFSVELYRCLRASLAPGGAIAVQATSPL
ncbi:MAG TPA: polyamine aminopropyltransferase, partial [Polyangiaceae bacterium]|nr:polyamine aminopropyltransferase [Polyangiaceae bacterium]